MHIFTYRKLSLTSPDHFCISSLGQVNLILDHLDHRSSRCEYIDRRKPVTGENFRYFLRYSPQRIIIRTACIPDIHPRSIMMLQKRYITFFKSISLFNLGTQKKPLCQKITAKRHVFLFISLNLGVCSFQLNKRILKASLHKSSLSMHDSFRTLPMIVCNLIIGRHTFIHLSQFIFQCSRLTIKHHQYGRGTKSPASPFMDTDSRARHLTACAAVQTTHGTDIIVTKEAHNQVTFSPQISSLFR